MMTMKELAAIEMRRVAKVWGAGDSETPKIRITDKDDRLAVQQAMDCAAGIYGIRVSDILARKKPGLIVQARQFTMLLCLNSGLSSPVTGNHMGRHHTTVLHGATVAKYRLDRERLVAPNTPVFRHRELAW